MSSEYTLIDWLEQINQPAPPEPIMDPRRQLPKKGSMCPYKRAVWQVMNIDLDRPAPKAGFFCKKCRGKAHKPSYHTGPVRVECIHCGGNTMRHRDVWGGYHTSSPSYGGSWHKVKGQSRSDLLAKRQREYRRWLKQVDRDCKNNPTSTFRYRAPDCGKPGCTAREERPKGKVRSIDDAMVQLQLLGVTV